MILHVKNENGYLLMNGKKFIELFGLEYRAFNEMFVLEKLFDKEPPKRPKNPNLRRHNHVFKIPKEY